MRARGKVHMILLAPTTVGVRDAGPYDLGAGGEHLEPAFSGRDTRSIAKDRHCPGSSGFQSHARHGQYGGSGQNGQCEPCGGGRRRDDVDDV